MVDRITPTTADADREFLAATYGLIDRWPVVAEPFRQWAVEDRFAAGRPALEDVGVLFTDDVHAWELYKLRLLNAGHTAIAYLGALAGITYVDEAVTDAAVGPFLSRLLLDEAVPTLTPIPGHPPQEYVATVLARFANTGVRDQIARLCVDGASKFATFLMPTIEANVARGGPLDMSALALAGWAHYLADTPVAAQARDDHGEPSRQLAATARDEPTAFLDGNDVVPNAVARDTRFRAAFETAHRRVTEIGPSRAIAVTLDG
jgi:mannitol 2-dehydrogenase